MRVRVDVQTAVSSEHNYLPSAGQLQRWVEFALQERMQQAELTIRLVDEQESAQLNTTYRHKSGPTNVLSFPFAAEVPLPVPVLGDLVICAPVMAREAHAQDKTAEAHWAHIVIHGTLHLLGFDHITPEQAHAMETVEIGLMEQLGYTNPYETGIPS